MASKRIQRVNELLQREIAGALYTLQFSPPLDLARVTVAGVSCSADLRSASVRISVLPQSDGTQDLSEVVRQLRGRRKDFQQIIGKNIVLKYTPHLNFEEDEGQAHADRIYRILDNLPPPADQEEPPDGPPA
jgi:ribosome-binding factor A